MHPVIVGLIIVAIVVVGIYAWRQEQARRKALRLWARRRGWRYSTDRRVGWDQMYTGQKLFKRGHSRNSTGGLSGEIDGRKLQMIDYKYVTGHGKNRSTHRYGMVIMHCGFPTVPLLIRRENPFDKVGEFLGLDDIDFESAEFSRKFYVKSADRKWAYDVIHTRTMEYLLKAPKLTIEFGLEEIAVYWSGRLRPEKCEQALDLACGLYDLIPDFLVRQMKGEKS